MKTSKLWSAFSGVLFQAAALIAPPASREWIAAIRAESSVAPPGFSQLGWAAGALIASLRANLIDGGGQLVLLALSLGMVASYFDVPSSSGALLRIAVATSALSISLFGGRSRAMLAVPPLVGGRALLVVCLGFPEPYSVDHMDVLYCAAPAAAGMCAGLALRTGFSRLRG